MGKLAALAVFSVSVFFVLPIAHGISVPVGMKALGWRNPIRKNPAPLQSILRGGDEEQTMGADLVVSFWEQLLPKLQKNVKAMLKSAEKALEHGAGVARAVCEGLQEQEQLIRKRDERLQQLIHAGEREDKSAFEEAKAQVNEAAVELERMLMVNLGGLLLLLRKIRTLQSTLEFGERLAEGGVLEELEDHVISMPQRRGEHLTEQEQEKQLERTRQRMNLDFLLRELRLEEAKMLSDAEAIPLPENFGKFEKAQKALLQLRQNKDAIAVLRWCNDNRRRLQSLRLPSALAHQAQSQQLIELVKSKRLAEACSFAAWWSQELQRERIEAKGQLGNGNPRRREEQDGGDDAMEDGEAEEGRAESEPRGRGRQSNDDDPEGEQNEIRISQQAETENSRLLLRRLLPLLAFQPSAEVDAVRGWFGEGRWRQLEEDLKGDSYRLNGALEGHTQPLLSLVLAAGIMGLKTKSHYPPLPPRTGRETVGERRRARKERRRRMRRTDAHDIFYDIAKDLPTLQHDVSRYVCGFTRKPLDENDPPCALPNGRVMAHSLVTTITDSYYGKDLPLGDWLDLDGLWAGKDAANDPNFRICQIIVT